MNIVNVLVPNAYKIQKRKDGTLISVIVDEELDPFDVEFTGAECIQINTNDMAYVTLSIDSLYQIIEMIEKAEKKYYKMKPNCQCEPHTFYEEEKQKNFCYQCGGKIF